MDQSRRMQERIERARAMEAAAPKKPLDISAGTHGDQVILHFGQAVTSVEMSAEDARQVAFALRRQANKVDPKRPARKSRRGR